jgi:amidohydrolase
MDYAKTLAAARAIEPWLVEIRRGLHESPELGLEEDKTADAICGKLGELGIPYERRGTAVIGLVEGAAPGAEGGRVVAMRADIDALPIQEATGATYASHNAGRMHACGHDAHTAILLGAARLLSESKGSMVGSAKLLFQPAEETVGGAAPMIAAGCLEKPRVDAVIGLHVQAYVPVGSVELKKGAFSGSSALLKVEIEGKAAHGAYPENGIDAILIAANVALSLNALVSRYVSPLDQAVLTIGRIQGGVAENVIASSVVMEGTLRTTSDATRELLIARARAVVEGVAASFGGTGKLHVEYGYAALVNDDRAVDLVAEVAGAMLGPGSVRWKEKPSMGVEDFSFFLKEVPGAFYNLGCGNPERGITAPIHSALFDIDEGCLAIGAALQASLALRIIEQGFHKESL